MHFQAGTTKRCVILQRKSSYKGRRAITTENLPLLSPHLAALQRTLSSGNAAALDLFWQEVETAGTPFIELITGDDSHLLVTFLYRAPLVESPVEVVCSLDGRGMIHESMARLLYTSLWYKTYQVRPGLRTEYWFSVDGVTQPDRFNSRLLVFPPDEDALFDPDVVESWFEVPPAEVEGPSTAITLAAVSSYTITRGPLMYAIHHPKGHTSKPYGSVGFRLSRHARDSPDRSGRVN